LPHRHFQQQALLLSRDLQRRSVARMRACDLDQNKQHQHRPAPPADLGDVPGPKLFSKTASVHRIVLTQFDVFTCWVDGSTGAAALEPRLKHVSCASSPPRCQAIDLTALLSLT